MNGQRLEADASQRVRPTLHPMPTASEPMKRMRYHHCGTSGYFCMTVKYITRLVLMRWKESKDGPHLCNEDHRFPNRFSRTVCLPVLCIISSTRCCEQSVMRLTSLQIRPVPKHDVNDCSSQGEVVHQLRDRVTGGISRQADFG